MRKCPPPRRIISGTVLIPAVLSFHNETLAPPCFPNTYCKWNNPSIPSSPDSSEDEPGDYVDDMVLETHDTADDDVEEEDDEANEEGTLEEEEARDEGNRGTIQKQPQPTNRKSPLLSPSDSVNPGSSSSGRDSSSSSSSSKKPKAKPQKTHKTSQGDRLKSVMSDMMVSFLDYQKEREKVFQETELKRTKMELEVEEKRQQAERDHEMRIMTFMAKMLNPPQMHMAPSPAVDTLHATPTSATQLAPTSPMSGVGRPEASSVITLQTQMTPPLGQHSAKTSHHSATHSDTATDITSIETSNSYTSAHEGTPGLLPNPPADEVPAVYPMSMLNYLNQDIDDQYVCNQY